MLQNFRFVALAGGMFAAAYVGVVWLKSGAPIPVYTVSAPKPDARIPTFEESVENGMRKHWEASKTSQSDGDKTRDGLRLAVLQAATAYQLSPCDKTMKANLVAALTAYTELWRDNMGCGFWGCDDKKLDAAAAAFSTPFDMRVREAVINAFEQDGISLDDFPAPVRNLVGGMSHNASAWNSTSCTQASVKRLK
jgi:hypothetical protein